jgi:flavin-dependent dehydrogenase
MKHSRLIKILGAGPAGLTAAINLAKCNYDVIVYEKNPDVGLRFHNDFQGIENWSTEEDVLQLFQSMSVNLDCFCNPFYAGILHGPTQKAHIKSNIPIFYVVKRGQEQDTLDNSLKKQAINSGVTISFNTPAAAQECDIIATGPKKADIFVTGIVFETNNEDAVIAILNDSVAPKGYAYLLISNKKATLATTVFRHMENSSKYLEHAVLKFREIIDIDIRNPKRFSGFGNFSILKTAINDGTICTGEAAGFQDFLFGFGIRYAITSGYLAAQSISEGVNYDALWKKQFGRKLRSSLINRKVYELFGAYAYDAFIRKIKNAANPNQLLLTYYNRSLLSFLCRNGGSNKEG